MCLHILTIRSPIMTDVVWCTPTCGITYSVFHHDGCRLVHPDMWYQLNAIRHLDGCRLMHPAKWDIFSMPYAIHILIHVYSFIYSFTYSFHILIHILIHVLISYTHSHTHSCAHFIYSFIYSFTYTLSFVICFFWLYVIITIYNLTTLCVHDIFHVMLIFMLQFVFNFHITFMFHEHIYTYCISCSYLLPFLPCISINFNQGISTLGTTI